MHALVLHCSTVMCGLLLWESIGRANDERSIRTTKHKSCLSEYDITYSYIRDRTCVTTFPPDHQHFDKAIGFCRCIYLPLWVATPIIPYCSCWLGRM